MYICEVCGRESRKKIRLGGYTLCSKHMHQLFSFGRFLDNNPRTINDLNDYEIIDDLVYFNVYNIRSEKISQFVIDLCDIEKVKYHKWRMSCGHIVTGQPSKGEQRSLSHIVLDIPKEKDYLVVDHINGDPTDNTRKNLRICKQSENVLNKSFVSSNTSGFIGVSYQKRKNRYDPEIRLQSIRCHLGYKKTLEEAVYARYIAEKFVFKEFANKEEQIRKYEFTKNLDESTKEKIYDITIEKLKSKGLWQ
jgi:hypothetical protein